MLQSLPPVKSPERLTISFGEMDIYIGSGSAEGCRQPCFEPNSHTTLARLGIYRKKAGADACHCFPISNIAAVLPRRRSNWTETDEFEA
jgi:hypothetical protein